MQTLPFVAAKPNMMSNQAESVSAKKTDESGTPFTQVLSKQIAKEDSTKPTNQASEARAGGEVKEENLTDTVENAVDTQEVDAQLLASDMTIKSVQDATDGKVVLDTPQTEVTDAEKKAAPVLTNITAAIQPEVKADDKLAKADLQAKVSRADVFDKRQGKAPSDSKATAAMEAAQQKDTAQLEADEMANDKFAQQLVTESKLKTVQDAAVGKAVSSVSEMGTVAVANTTLQQPVAKLTTTAVQQPGSDNHIPVYPGKAGWNEAVSQKIVWMVGATEQSAKLTLNPPELGPLEVTIHVNNDKADTTFISESPEVRKALEDGVSTLRQLMGQAGVELGQANINSSKQQQAFQQAQLAKQGAGGEGADVAPDIVANTAGSVVSRQSNGLVDTFA